LALVELEPYKLLVKVPMVLIRFFLALLLVAVAVAVVFQEQKTVELEVLAVEVR
jgi:hypothetical protein